MPIYQYRAIDDYGQEMHDELYAEDTIALAQSLKNIGVWLLEAKEKSGTHKKLEIKVKRQELVDLYASIAIMLKAGVSLVDTLKSVAQHASNISLKEGLITIRLAVEEGVPLSEAMAQFENVFPKQVTGVISAGEQSGMLPETFKELRDYYEWVNQLVGDVKQASTYPIIVLIVIILFILILFTFVVPKFAVLLNGLGVDMPSITLMVFSLSQFTLHYWWVILTAPVIVVTALRVFYKRSALFRQGFDDWKLNIPIFGEINRMIALSRFTHHFSMMYRAGIPIIDCLKESQLLVGNAKLAAIIAETERSVSEGNPMSRVLEKHHAFPPMVLQMLKVGESTGELDASMREVSNYYDKEIPRRMKRLFSIMEPVIMLTLIGIVGFVAAAIFLPMISMMGAV